MTDTTSPPHRSWPEQQKDTFTLVGRFIHHWAGLEGTLGWVLSKAFKLEIEDEFILTSNMGVRDKINVAKTVIHVHGRDLPEEWRRAAKKVFERIADMSYERNMVAHTPFGPGPDSTVRFDRVKARGTLNLDDVHWTPEYFEKLCTEMELLSDLLMWMSHRVSGAILSDYPVRPTEDRELLDLKRALIPPSLFSRHFPPANDGT